MAPSPAFVADVERPGLGKGVDSAEDKKTNRLQRPTHWEISKASSLFVFGNVVLVLLLIPMLLGVQAMLVLISQKGADFVATFQVLMTIVNFVMACFSALSIGVFPLVAMASSTSNYLYVGVIVRVSLAACVVCGTVGALVLSLMRKDFIELFSKESDRENMLYLGEDTLMLMSVGFLPSLVQYSFMSIYQGLGCMPQLMAIACVQLLVALAFILAMYADYGLLAFGWGNIAGSSLACTLSCVYLVGFSKKRHLYRFCSLSCSDFNAFKEILGKMGWVSLRSVFNQMRMLVLVVLVTRLGVVYGAVYPALLLRMFYAIGPPTLVAYFFIPFMCSRLWGSHSPALALQLFTDYFKVGLFFCILATLYVAYPGKTQLELTVEEVVHEAEDMDSDIITWNIFVLFILQCIIRPVAIMYDGACIALGQVRGCGISVLVGFLVSAAIAVGGRGSFEAIYFAEMCFFLVRGTMLHFVLLRAGWAPLRNFPDGVILEQDWMELVDEAKTQRWFYFPLRRIYLGYVTTCLMDTFYASKLHAADSGHAAEASLWRSTTRAPEHSVFCKKDISSSSSSTKTTGTIVEGKREGVCVELSDEPGYMLATDGTNVSIEVCEKELPRLEPCSEDACLDNRGTFGSLTEVAI